MQYKGVYCLTQSVEERIAIGIASLFEPGVRTRLVTYLCKKSHGSCVSVTKRFVTRRVMHASTRAISVIAQRAGRGGGSNPPTTT